MERYGKERKNRKERKERKDLQKEKGKRKRGTKEAGEGRQLISATRCHGESRIARMISDERTDGHGRDGAECPRAAPGREILTLSGKNRRQRGLTHVGCFHIFLFSLPSTNSAWRILALESNLAATPDTSTGLP